MYKLYLQTLCKEGQILPSDIFACLQITSVSAVYNSACGRMQLINTKGIKSRQRGEYAGGSSNQERISFQMRFAVRWKNQGNRSQVGCSRMPGKEVWSLQAVTVLALKFPDERLVLGPDEGTL